MTNYSTWEVSYRVTVTLEREGDEDYMPSGSESRDIDRMIKGALDDAEVAEIGDWTVYDWTVESA